MIFHWPVETQGRFSNNFVQTYPLLVSIIVFFLFLQPDGGKTQRYKQINNGNIVMGSLWMIQSALQWAIGV